MLNAPLAPTFLKLAWPSVLIMMAQASTGLTEAWFVAKLGSNALAGMALVVPLVMLMQTLSAGAMGGAIASNIARALGAGQRDRANAIVAHAMVVNVVIGLVCSLIILAVGERLYTLLGGDAAAVHEALAYSSVVFAGMVLLWLMNAMASVIRGTGNMIVPGFVICGGAILLVPLSPCLIFGFGPIPAMGMAGAGWALLLYYAVGCVILGWYVLSGRNEATLGRAKYDGSIVRSLLVMGGTGALNATHINLAIAAATGLVGAFAGAIGVGAYGIGARLEYMLIPLAFGLGSPMLALVGTNIGARQHDRALRSALVGGGIAFALTETVGLLAAIWPQVWIGLFTDDPQILAVGVTYLHIVGPFYGFFGLGLSLYFASQGAGRLGWPLVAALVRLIVTVGGGWLALRLTNSLEGLFAAVSVGMVLYCVIICGSIKAGAWTRNRP